jgi:hypothetical protein
MSHTQRKNRQGHYIIDGVVHIPTTFGDILIDEEDYERFNRGGDLEQYHRPAVKWKDTEYRHGKVYPCKSPHGRVMLTIRGTNKRVILARLLLGVPPHLQVDHINRNTLDNRRCNLSLVTPAQNNINRGPSTDGYRNVKKGKRSWKAEIRIDGTVHKQTFDTDHEAALYVNRLILGFYPQATALNTVPCYSDTPVPRDENCSTCNAECECCCACTEVEQSVLQSVA